MSDNGSRNIVPHSPPYMIFYDFFRRNVIPQALIMAETGRIVQANDAACAYYGLAPWPDPPPCLNNFDTNHPLVTIAELNLAAKGIEHTFRSTHRTALGEREVEIRTCPATAGSEPLILATIYDVTAQVTRERAVSADEERWRSALSGSGDGVWDWDITSDEVSCSPRWKEMLGYGRYEIGHDIREWLSLVCHDDSDQVTTAYEKILAGGCNRTELEYRMRGKHGGLIWILDRCTVLRWDIDGRPARIISVHSDITVQKITETKLRFFNESLEREVAERTAALNRELAVREEAERRLRASHERLAALTEELCLTEEREQRKVASWLHDDVGQNLALLKIHLDRMSQRSFAGRQRFREMSELLAATIKEIRNHTMLISPPLLENLGLCPAIAKLANDLGKAHGFAVQVDEQQILPELPLSLRSTLYRIVKELFINVVKHAGADRVMLVNTYDGEWIGISVRDNGQGFDAEQLETAATASNSFGLFHVRQRLYLLGGTLDVDSSPGLGCTCSIRVPVRPREPGHQDFPD